MTILASLLFRHYENTSLSPSVLNPSNTSSPNLAGKVPSELWQCWFSDGNLPTTTTTTLHLFNGLFQDNQGKSAPEYHSGFYCSKRWWSGSGISWTICKWFAPWSRHITMPVPHHSVVTGPMPVLPPNQQRQSTEGIWHVKTSLNFFQRFSLRAVGGDNRLMHVHLENDHQNSLRG